MFVSKCHEGVRTNRIQFDTIKKSIVSFYDNRVYACYRRSSEELIVFSHTDTHTHTGHFLIQFFNIFITCATQKKNKKNEVCQIQNSIFVQYIWIRLEITFVSLQEMVIFPVNRVRTIFGQNVKTLKFHTKVHLRFNECKNVYTWQNGLKISYDATVASSLSSGS